MSTGTPAAFSLALGGLKPRAYLFALISTLSSPSTPSILTRPDSLARRTTGSGPDSTASSKTLVPPARSPYENQRRTAPTTSASNRTPTMIRGTSLRPGGPATSLLCPPSSSGAFLAAESSLSGGLSNGPRRSFSDLKLICEFSDLGRRRYKHFCRNKLLRAAREEGLQHWAKGRARRRLRSPVRP